MNLSILIGLIFGFYVMHRAIGFEDFTTLFLQIDSLLIVLGGTFSAVIVSHSFKQLLNIPILLFRSFLFKRIEAEKDILFIVDLAKKVKSNGKRSIIPDVNKVKNSFLKLSLQLFIDNTETDELEKLMTQNIVYIQKKDFFASRIFLNCAKFSPAFGLLGTVIGLVKLLSQLDDPAAVGPGMALALITTFYGIVLANLIFSPLAARLEGYSDEVALHSEMLMIGILALSKSENPYVVQEKMELFYSVKIKEKRVKK